MKNARWDNKTKMQYREDCIINIYQRIYSRTTIPQNTHYITLAGTHTKGNKPLPGAELPHLLRSGLLQSHQFIGVDNDETIIKANKAAYPEAIWLRGDITQIMLKPKLNPAIIHLDTINMASRAYELTEPIMERVEELASQTMLVINLVLRRWRETTAHPVCEFLHLLDTHTTSRGSWTRLLEVYQYLGASTGHTGRSLMGTYTLFYNK